MITNSELRISNESYTKRDFYQIYPEILDIVAKITDRWDPSSSNESDPGVVLLKLLAFIADKTNYNLDKNILECFMPSATQEESMRKLCDMMGYDMHYYISAATKVSFMWVGDELEDGKHSITIPRFTTICDANQEITYVLTEPVTLQIKGQEYKQEAIEGQLKNFAINNGYVIKLTNLDDRNRLYLPEYKIAQNGIWIWNDSADSRTNIENAKFWTQVDNLNTQEAHKTVWKFGFDSKKRLPYVQFPDDIAELIGEGLCLNYILTSGVNGNIKAKTLTKLSGVETLDITPLYNDSNTVSMTDDSNSSLVIQNNSYTINGQDVETLDEAYNGFKKTIGTFDTLITCRDYANKIYQLVTSDTDRSPLVSNVQVTDIRDDINFVNKVITFNEHGLVYADFVEKKGEKDLISHFDLYLYPLNPSTPMNVETEKLVNFTVKDYENTFKPNYSNFYEITKQLEDYKAISHNITQLNSASDDLIYLIKNYYHLKAKISTSYKVSKYEGNEILKNIYSALFKNFNARKLDYGEEIPYDTLVSVIQNADPRIKSITLEDSVKPVVMMPNQNEFDLSATTTENQGKAAYFKLLAKNVLAGKLPLFNYDKRFRYDLGEVVSNEATKSVYGVEFNYPTSSDPILAENADKYSITHIGTGVNITLPLPQTGYKLRENEVVQLIAPNLNTVLTYPAYIYYFLLLNIDEERNYKEIKANTEYKLQQGEILFINYTDSTDRNMFIMYKGEANGGSIVENGKISAFSGIIRPSFTVKDSRVNAGQNNFYWKRSGQNGEPNYKENDKYGSNWDDSYYLASLSGSEQIEIRDFVRTTCKKQLLCYWITKDNKLTFERNKNFTCILDANEYFFFTDSLKNTLNTFGSGTTLQLQYTTPPSGDAVVWTLNSEKEVEINDVANNGIGAFSDTAWQVKNFSNDNKLIIEENQIISLGEDNIIKGLTQTTGFTEINNNWQQIPEGQCDTFKYDSTPLPKFENLSINWKIRSSLTLNVGIEKNQELKSNQWIEIYTSYWGAQYPTPTSDFSKLTETPINLPFKTNVTRLTNCTIRSNYNLQESGNANIPTARISFDGQRKDDLAIYIFEEKPLLNGLVYTDIYSIDIDKIGTDQNDIPVFIPKGNYFGVMMFYYLKAADDQSDNKPKIIVKGGSDYIIKYAESNDDTKAYGHSIDLEEGINIIRVKDSCTLQLDKGSVTKGKILFGNCNVISYESGDGCELPSGINYELLNIPKDKCGKFLDILLSLEGSDQFYFNADLPNSTQIDVKEFDEYGWFNYNNIANKFVLAELDTDLSDIEIAKSSRVGQW